MSFFNKVFASIGIGAAGVDTKLSRDEFVAGDVVDGVVEVFGGNIEQQIDEIYLLVMTNYIKESNDTKVSQQATIGKIKVVEPFVIGVNERRSIPFNFQLPVDTPVTLGSTKVYIHTGLDIKNAVDPTDKDYIRVLPSKIISAVLNAAYELGFTLRKVENEAAPYYLRRRLPFVQEFEFYPTSGPFRGKLDEIEIVFLDVSNDRVEVLLEVDRRARGLGGLFAEALEMDESKVRFTVEASDVQNVKQQLYSLISRYS